MPQTALLISAIAAYAIASFLAFRNTQHKQDDFFTSSYLLAAIGCAAHIFYALQVSDITQNLDLSLSSMIPLVNGLLVVVFLLACTAMPIKRLGILVYPLTIICLIFAYFWDSAPSPISSLGANSSEISRALNIHILISILSYALLAIAAIQSLLYAYQDHKIKTRASSTLLSALPPLQTMEQLLFRLVASGFILLSLTLISGALFSQQIFGQPFEFKHHTVLAILGWIVFGTLLYKRFAQGLRGSNAVIWTIGGFMLIQLGYFGTKIISESMKIQ